MKEWLLELITDVSELNVVNAVKGSQERAKRYNNSKARRRMFVRNEDEGKKEPQTWSMRTGPHGMGWEGGGGRAWRFGGAHPSACGRRSLSFGGGRLSYCCL
jgi:hypothetical protein